VTLTFDSYLESDKLNQQAKYLGQRSLSLTATVRTHSHTHGTNCYNRTTKTVGNEKSVTEWHVTCQWRCCGQRSAYQRRAFCQRFSPSEPQPTIQCGHKTRVT